MHGLLWVAVKRDEILVSDSIERALASEFMLTRARHMKFWDTYEEISEKLGDEGIEFAAIKGVTNEARWYDEMGERPCRDVDIWIGPPQSDRFGEALHSLCPNHPLVRDIQSLVDRDYVQGIDFHLSSGVSVDMHADLLKLGLPAETRLRCWAETQINDFGDMQLRVLSEGAVGFHSVVHGNVDTFSRLLGVAEFQRILDRSRLIATDIEPYAVSEGIRTPFVSSIHAIESALETEISSARSHLLPRLIWRTIWPSRIQLRGSEGDRRVLRRRLIQFFRFTAWLGLFGVHFKRLVPPDELLRYAYPLARGPYLWRVVRCRLEAMFDRS